MRIDWRYYFSRWLNTSKFITSLFCIDSGQLERELVHFIVKYTTL